MANSARQNPYPQIIAASDWQKIIALKNEYVTAIVSEYIAICRPHQVIVVSDTPEEVAAVRQMALTTGSEQKIAIAGHAIHYDGYCDQGRDKEHTRILVSDASMASKRLNTLDRAAGLAEIRQLLDGIMAGKEMLVRFFCLGPLDSAFAIPALQITDSAYVAHCEDLLYRPGYR